MRRTRIAAILFFLAAAACFSGMKLLNRGETTSSRPVIEMDSDTITVSVEEPEEALLSGVTATDKKDGDITDSLFVETCSNFVADNTREISIVAVDSDGNVAKQTREVIYSDYQPPHFTLSAPLRFAVKTEDLTDNMGATDCIDGDISSQVKVSNAYTMSSTAGDYLMEFTVANSAGDVAHLTATVTLYNSADESKAPKIGLSEYLVYVKAGEKLNAKSYLKTLTVGYTEYQAASDGYFHRASTLASEEETGIPVSAVKITDGVDYSTPGDYEITYDYSDTSGSAEVRLIVVVE